MSSNSSGDSASSFCYRTDLYAVGLLITLIDAASIIPIYTLVVYLAVQKWRQQRSFRTTSHADIFTYHVAAFRLIWVLALCFNVRTLSPSAPKLITRTSYGLLSITWYGENFIHVLTCVEQYLAVVHPIVYRGLRNARGVKIRNISIGCVWLLSSISGSVVGKHFDPKYPILFMSLFAISLVVVSFCCLSVLCVLVRPGPGERTRGDRSKQRAFLTITTILLMLWLWLGGILVIYGLNSLENVSLDAKCLLMTCMFLFNLPSGLITPVLYLHRAGKLSFCLGNKG